MIYPKYILIVDDDPVFRLIETKLLEKSYKNLQVGIAENGFEAITLLKQAVKEKQRVPDLILLDIGMPVMSGWEFMEEFIKIPAEAVQGIQIYVVSSSADQEDKNRRYLYPQIKAYITKPLSMATVKGIFEQLETGSKVTNR